MKERKNIIYVGNFDFVKPGAAVFRAINNLKAIENTHDVSIFGFSNEDTEYKEGHISYYLVKKPKSIKEWIIYFLSNSKIKDTSVSEYETIIIFYNLPVLKMISIMLNLKKNAKYISDITEWYTVIGKNYLVSLIKSIDIFLRMNTLPKKMNGLIVMSTLLEKKYSTDKVHNLIIIPPLVSETYTPEKNEITSESKDSISIIYSGSPDYDKDRLDILVDAIYQLVLINTKHDILLDIYGVEMEEFISIFNYDINKIKKIGCKIKFHGYVPHEESIKNLRKADYSVVLRNQSRRNDAGFPTKFVESYSFGIPVIASRFSDIEKYKRENDIFINELSVNNLVVELEKKLVETTKYKNNNRFYYKEYETKLLNYFDNI